MSSADRNSRQNVRSSFAATQRSRLSEGPNKKPARSSLANPTSSSFQKPKPSNKRQSDVNMEETNISVYVRCRSRNDREIKENSGVVVSTMGHMGKEVVLQTGPMSVSNKTYTFDRVFGAESDQDMVYDGIASNVLEEMLQGYNCTVFAYGQTGTGKTHTMSGDIKMSGAHLSENAGIIPRTLVALFKQLEKSPEFSVKISFIELYNEELRDLLITNETGERKVRIFEEPGKKSIVVQGMEEIFIKSATEGMKVLADGSYKRQVAATQCNDLSSRSHTVFTITVHMKEIDPISGEEYLKIGKLNLVDLAGSENINRSGAENKRAREAGIINQSLLTLGRVINALVDQSPHIPYRESKLTRLLQDSLGGKTKTCIIATISPAKVSLEETISTLEYANRAKSIKNKPQVNSSMSKKMLIKEYVQEIERLRNDLNATRAKNGIYVTEENWQQVTAESESRRIQVEEQKLRMEVLEEQIKKFKGNFEAQLEQLNKVENELQSSKKQYGEVHEKLEVTNAQLNTTAQKLRLESIVSEEYRSTEKKLHNIGKSLTKLLDNVDQSKDVLYEAITKKSELEIKNFQSLESAKDDVRNHTSNLGSQVFKFHNSSTHLSTVLNQKFGDMVETQKGKIENSCQGLKRTSSELSTNVNEMVDDLISNSEATNTKINDIENVKQQIKSHIVQELSDLKGEAEASSKSITVDLNDLEKIIDQSFDSLGQHVNSTIETVKNQLETQSAEIIELRAKVVEHQTKYIDMIKHQSLKLENFKETERQKSKIEKQQLLEKITSLVDAYDNARNERIDTEIDTIRPDLDSIIVKQEGFTAKFESFINNNWLQTQSQFQQQLQEEGNRLKFFIDASKKSINDESISKIVLNIMYNKYLQADKINKSISSLDEGLISLSQFAESLKMLNGENCTLTQERLDGFKSTITKSFETISKNFQTIGEELKDSKPQLVDEFLQRQGKFLSEFKESSLNTISTLEKYFSSVSYIKDDEQPPKRQKIEIIKDLPKSKTRDELKTIHHEEIFGIPKIEEEIMLDVPDIPSQNASPVPVPDRPFKQPLATSTRDLNIQRRSSNDTLKQEPQKQRSRPNSSLSQNSI